MISGICQICGRVGRVHTCSLCGRSVCSGHYLHDKSICISCKGQKRLA